MTQEATKVINKKTLESKIKSQAQQSASKSNIHKKEMKRKHNEDEKVSSDNESFPDGEKKIIPKQEKKKKGKLKFV